MCNGKACQCDLTELPNSVNMTDQLTMYYNLSDKNITFMFEIDLCQRFAIVFNYTRLNPSSVFGDDYDITNRDMLLFFWSTTYSTFYAYDMFGYSSTALLTDEFFGEGYQNWDVLGYAIIGERVRVKVTRYIITNDTEDYQFSTPQTNLGYLVVYDNGGVVYGNYNRGVVNIDFTTEINYVQKYEKFTIIGHSIFLFIFWGILSDVGIFFGRQLKSYPKYAKVHGIIFLFQGIITYIFAFSKIQYNKTKIQEIYYYDGLIITHFIIGVIIISLITIQLMMGMIVKNNLESLNGSNKIYKIKKIHYFLGYLLYFITKAQVAIGVHLDRPDLLTLFYGFYILLFFSRVAIEILYHYEVSLIPRTRVTYQYVELDRNQIYENLIDKINSNVPRNQLVKEYQKLNYIILREAIYDVSDFNHPGGQYILEKIAGREIGRYFYGGFPIQNLHIKLHRHTLFAINYIETRYLGDYRNDNCPLMYCEENMVAVDKYIWRFEQYIPIANDVGMFVFQSHFFQIRQFVKGVQWLGRYYYIKPYGTGLDLAERPYSVVMCYSTANINRRQALIDFFKAQVIEGNDMTFPSMETTILSNDIVFVVKKQDFSTNMSRFLHSTGHKPYEITGPYGLGLEIDAASDGIHYIFCQGTGILPFLDLIDFLLRKAIYQILYDQRGKQIADYINDNNEEYLTTLGQDFQLILHGSFSDIDHFYGFPIVQDLLFICKTFNLQYFDMIVRIKDHTNGTDDLHNYMVNSHFDLQYMKKYVKYKPTKVYVCGSPDFEEDVSNCLFDLGIPKKYLVIV